mmetsp:Transcript_11941/g.13398  ORF Transcript_11941/g.13398 Transcript_11941/m.13398 type:complete len:92 (+) Transcript_11941:123-398(+)
MKRARSSLVPIGFACVVACLVCYFAEWQPQPQLTTAFVPAEVTVLRSGDDLRKAGPSIDYDPALDDPSVAWQMASPEQHQRPGRNCGFCMG